MPKLLTSTEHRARVGCQFSWDFFLAQGVPKANYQSLFFAVLRQSHMTQKGNHAVERILYYSTYVTVVSEEVTWQSEP